MLNKLYESLNVERVTYELVDLFENYKLPTVYLYTAIGRCTFLKLTDKHMMAVVQDKKAEVKDDTALFAKKPDPEEKTDPNVAAANKAEQEKLKALMSKKIDMAMVLKQCTGIK